MKRIILSGVYLFLAVGMIAQTAVLNVNESGTMKGEAVASYFLPRTVLEVEVEAIRTIREVGPYAADARKHFGAPAKIQRNEESWTINTVNVTQKSEPDVRNQYRVYVPAKSNAALLALTETGILRGINLPFSSEKEARHLNTTQEEEKVTGSSFIFNYYIHETDSSESPASAVFDQINSLREARLNILLQYNDVLQHGSAVEAYLREIDKREEDLKALFNGIERKEVVRRTFIVYPDNEVTGQKIFHFSEAQGFSETGSPVTITLRRNSAEDRLTSSEKKDRTGFVYRMPALVEVEVAGGDKTVFWSGQIGVAQLGKLVSLPAGLFDKDNIRAVFDTNTGALLQIGR